MTDHKAFIDRAVRFALENQKIGLPIGPEIDALVEELVITGASEYECSVAVAKLTEAIGIFPKCCVEAGDYFRKIERQVRLNRMSTNSFSVESDIETELPISERVIERICGTLV